MQINNVAITIHGGQMDEAEVREYIAHIRRTNRKQTLQSLDLTIDGDYVDMRYKLAPVPFERIRRITGYPVGAMNRWNDAKRAEERDRVKHG